ncbi:hypothetical protein K466DRAFT_577313 [Polyporus arcularius HHB13444]|uniref:Integrase core domain-containing protein n=1 Tax=Polyporus arcularius HHB13444 TaxID=1314778 RepID=A0A5C3P854_9APHY|nr:hypothetical protein K466DRAFT_577313 [Polyporus arcularius HHB13444]
MEVAVWMITHRGPNRASFMWGSSTRNTRIERMWVEVGTQFALRWRAFFTRLERRHRLDPEEPGHLWLLHMLFLDDINADCRAFQHEWNHHPISGIAKNQTPADMRLLSDLTQGYLPGDDLNDIHPNLLSRYYGAEGRKRRLGPGQTGAGHYEDDPSEDTEDLDDHVAADQQRHVRHAPIPVPSSNSPFSQENEQIFVQCLHAARAEELVPEGYGLTEAEWGNVFYGDDEEISLGRSGKKAVVELPFSVWFRRAVEWAQALQIMSQLLMLQNGDI